jgi:hypothetical protein
MLSDEQLLTFSQAIRHFPNRPSATTVWRWAVHGVGGLKLESTKIGGNRYTSLEAIQRFIATCNPDDKPRRDLDSVDRELSAEGI